MHIFCYNMTDFAINVNKIVTNLFPISQFSTLKFPISKAQAPFPKHPGKTLVRSGVLFCSSLSINSEQQGSAGTVRQHDSGGIHKSSGGNQVHLPVSTGLGPVPLVGSKQYISESGLSAGGSECPSGRLVKGYSLPRSVPCTGAFSNISS